jgi:deazaflavin-dependent oxidoreductase (nitroreductase family)
MTYPPEGHVWDPPWKEPDVIEEFRSNGGEVASFHSSQPFLLLTTTGRKSGLPRTKPMTYQAHEGSIYVFASKGGFPTPPEWYLNLVASPRVTVEIGAETFEANARVTEGAERAEVFTRQIERLPEMAEYQKRSGRSIPVVALEPLVPR